MRDRKKLLVGLGLIVVAALGWLGSQFAFAPSIESGAQDNAPLVVLSSTDTEFDPKQAEILQKIQESGGAAALDLSGRDLTALDLSPQALARVQQAQASNGDPVWLLKDTGSADLSGINLSRAVLVRAKLTGADLVDTNLEGAQLIEADLRDTNLANTNLRGANLATADLRGANLAKTNLTSADLSFARLAGANLWKANLSDAYLIGADLSGANLAFADVSRVNLAQAARLDGAFLYDSRMEGARLTRKLLGEQVGEERAGEYRRARAVYLAIKNMFRDAGDYGDARWATIKEHQMEQATHWPGSAARFYPEELRALPSDGVGRIIGHGAFYVRHTLSYLGLVLWGLISGYNQNSFQVVLSAVVLWLGLALLFRVSNGLDATDYHKLKNSEYMHYSLSALAGRNFETVQPTGTLARVVTRAAPFIGFALIALLIVTLNN